MNERSSMSSEMNTPMDENELEDQRLRFFLDYLNIIYGTTSVAFKKGSIDMNLKEKDNSKESLF